ncbi:PREDICTED: peptidyl-prolyl cis-trans isomerase-like 4 isoform X2 [Cyphomyrmex costatus]|uniref:peptidyl-prolyl cis-trans isomerase-like 4 isoform X2 n=1 Tax=Cyphomyrmex costatus TaxID=456900 RepID=UPI000852270E|nr:PREDICTED: peptidyl-prolyl cis-trans isomerase-like 4 isoform X2 [Cyphomyrmex costatus]
MAVVVETTIGDFTVDLYTEERPQTTRNFLKLCKLKYYNWNLFHSVQTNFIAQTGDPTGTGKGGESVYGIVLGLLSMVNCGNNMLGSQFFITLGSELQSLDNEHCVFGEITEGLEVVLKFNETICDGDQRPYQDIRISHTVILEDPFDDPMGFVVPDRSPEPTKEALMSDRIGADEAIDDTGGMTTEEITEMQKNKEAKARATILEIVGDIPDADIAPPENVLFICKLNPVTNDDDLEIIFSRFGKIVGCEVIRDHQTGDSLQYAFIEFADRKSCEDAYFKMDNVLIDDRRIHVDFSQSVAKMRWRGKGKGIRYFDEDDKPKKREENYSSRKPDALHDRNHDNGKSKEEGKRKESDKDRSSEHRKHERRREDRDRRKEDRSYDDHYERNKYGIERKDRRRKEERRDKDRSDQRKGHSEDRLERRGRRDDYSDRERRHRDNERKRPDDNDDTRHRSHKHKRKR